jgi:hypothetical protein
MSLRTNGSVRIDTTLSEIETWVTNAEQHGGGWVPILMHHICEGCDEYSVTPEILEGFLDWLEARKSQGTITMTVAQVMGIGTPPPPPDAGVDAPPPPPDAPPDAMVDAGPPPANLLQNPSLEIDANGNGVPDCWSTGGFGTSTSTFTRTTDAFDGSFAERLDITSFGSGAKRLYTTQGTGTCSPAASAGQQFTVRAAYHANTPPRFTIYTRNTAGTWNYFTESPPLPVSQSYTTASFSIPALPAGTTNIGVALSIYAVGSITMDDFSLTQP